MKLSNKYPWLNEINETWQSTLLTKQSYEKLCKMLEIKSPSLNLLYRATRDGFQKVNFHKNSDNQGSTICLVKSEIGRIFGGFAEPSWNSKPRILPNPVNLLFSSWISTPNTNSSRVGRFMAGTSGGWSSATALILRLVIIRI
jgi:hypothetical protein